MSTKKPPAVGETLVPNIVDATLDAVEEALDARAAADGPPDPTKVNHDQWTPLWDAPEVVDVVKTPAWTPEGFEKDAIWMPLDELDMRPASEVRLAVDKDAVARYAEAVDDLTPIHVVMETGTDRKLVADGRHRALAHKAAGKRDVRCYWKDGTYLDAYKHACHANDAHGLVATDKDKQHRVKVALKHPEMGNWSLRKLADVCGVSHTLVGTIKTTVKPLQSSSPTIGKDGRSYNPPTPKDPSPKATTTTAPPVPESSTEPWSEPQLEEDLAGEERLGGDEELDPTNEPDFVGDEDLDEEPDPTNEPDDEDLDEEPDLANEPDFVGDDVEPESPVVSIKPETADGAGDEPKTFPCPYDLVEAGRAIACNFDGDGLHELVHQISEVSGLALVSGMGYPVDAFSDPEDFVADLPDDVEWLTAVAELISQRLMSLPVETTTPPSEI